MGAAKPPFDSYSYTPYSMTSPATKTSAIRVLLIDDHPFVRQGVALALQEVADIEVVGESSDSQSALPLVEKLKPDVVVTDLTLPDKSGLDLIRTLHHIHPQLHMLVLSMHEEDLYAERCLRAGAKGYLMKSHGPEQLVGAIRTVAQGRIYVSGELAQNLLQSLASPLPLPASTGRDGALKDLSDREFEVFELVGRGKTAKEIAHMLGLSSKTVDVHRARIREKLKLLTTPDLMHYAVRWTQARENAS